MTNTVSVTLSQDRFLDSHRIASALIQIEVKPDGIESIDTCTAVHAY